jgi:protein-L-isoaspartate(D-aspartate) O-methyltransferase
MIMAATNERLFNPYADVPRPIGWNTTISSPSMHAETLNNLLPILQTARSVLDIGTGSGFITAAMAYLTHDNCKVYAMDHIKEINDFAMKNIQTICPGLWRKNKIKFIT